MKYLLILILTTLTFSVFAKEQVIYEIGDELKLKRDNSVVLYFYKNDAIELSLNRDFLDSLLSDHSLMQEIFIELKKDKK